MRPLVRCVLALGTLAGCTANQTLVAPEPTPCQAGELAPARLRVASYNVRAGLETSLDQVGDLLETISADVVALQEVDRNVDRTQRVDQARVLAERLGYQHVFAAAMDRGGGEYGVALLSRRPIASAERVSLRASLAYEPRVAIDAHLCLGEKTFRVVATHADFLPWSAAENASAIAEAVKESVGSGVIVAGDFNQTAQEDGPKRLMNVGLRDVVGKRAEGVTFWPNGTRIDFLFADRPLDERVADTAIVEKKASDHYPIWADFDVSTL